MRSLDKPKHSLFRGLILHIFLSVLAANSSTYAIKKKAILTSLPLVSLKIEKVLKQETDLNQSLTRANLIILPCQLIRCAFVRNCNTFFSPSRQYNTRTFH